MTKEIYLAPMEGLTGYIIRNAFHHHFDYIDKYYTPFIPAAKRMNFKIKNDISPDNNAGIFVVPQLMTIIGEEAMEMAHKLREYGYEEININLGCPSGTVVSKGRGSGILANPEKLDNFLYELYSISDMKVTIKTRVGFENDELWDELLQIYCKYPISELTIHPRVQKDFYKGEVRLYDFDKAYQMIDQTKTRLVYNGDIDSPDKFMDLSERYPDINSFMIGRGMFMHPSLAAQIKGVTMEEAEYRQRLKGWHDEILNGYLAIFSGEKDAIFRMKEIWSYLRLDFENSDKLWKKIKKAQNLTDYKAAVSMVL